MYSLQYRPQMDHNKYGESGGGGLPLPPPFSGYWVWSVYGLYCRLYMAYAQLMYGPYMAYVWPTYGTYIDHIWPYEGLVICPILAIYGHVRARLAKNIVRHVRSPLFGGASNKNLFGGDQNREHCFVRAQWFCSLFCSGSIVCRNVLFGVLFGLNGK